MSKIKIGILGCGAIGSRIAHSIINGELKGNCELIALFDIDNEKLMNLSRSLNNIDLVYSSFEKLINESELMVEAVNAPNSSEFIRDALNAKTHVMAMSTGKLLYSPDLFSLATKNSISLLIPSGAIAGIDAIKAACLKPIEKIVLTSRKPPSGFLNNHYIQEKGINLNNITGETVLFEGRVEEAVQHFPRNLNVAATLALASGNFEKIIVRILTSPKYTLNSHEIEIVGEFGRMTSLTENVICPDNPKTSYLAVLSGIQTLKNFCNDVHVGT